MMTSTLPDFALEVYFAKHEFTAKYHLTASDAESVTISDLLAMATEAERDQFNNLGLGYTQTWGAPELRAAVAATYDNVTPEQVLIFAGAQEPMFWALQTLVGAGDHVIVTVPNYQSMESVPIAAGAEVSGLPIWEGSGASLNWTLDLDRLRALLRPNTKLIAVNAPNNPTGFVPDADTWRELNQLCDERGIVLFSDEVYRGIELDPSKRIDQAADISPTAISLNVMSKAYGLPGLRIGWLASRNAAALARIERCKHYTSICSAGPSEVLATIALRNRTTLIDRNVSILRDNYAQLCVVLERCHGLIDWYAPDGGCVLFPRFTGPDGVEAFAASLVEDQSAVVLPASIYKSQLLPIPDDRFRLGIGRAHPGPGWAALEAHLSLRAERGSFR
jgi:aspartate/methionine/tyrosine aminotransferase